MKQYVSIIFKLKDEIQRAVLNYNLSNAGVESIEEREDDVIAYFGVEEWEEAKSELDLDGIDYEVVLVKNENWNAKWEASFEPVNINDFCYVRAPFHPESEKAGLIDIILEPKMAFGTAHHETTYMMMSEMKEIKFEGEYVFDYGCGTAILSILAEKLGASGIYAIDIEENAVENAKYNAEINGCEKITCEQKTLEETDEFAYDIILANINRGVLLNSAKPLKNYLKPGGVLLLSGILREDEDLVLDAYKAEGYTFVHSIQKGEWKCVKLSVSI
ncbi:50S ribosomal protein L11 methyltransferase [Portibacter lacus]|uniref:Ribosomal protein L11 methyltransferase n=1 Tax=Portibacter lacus TaxID=1099794 RepID=A0AA37SL25_9BACT|nr:50S ribosomal protein L11 methyltransferase [Portibacter lacus]GLR15499.1 ribosomal protein L11 methyltransferase [Portibacter lacus]